MSGYFSQPKSLGRKVKVELDLSNYSTKSDSKTSDLQTLMIHQNLLKTLI